MNFFKKNRADVIGIPADEFNNARESIEQLYNEAHARQKSPDAKPSEYMRGLAAALCVLDDLQPRAL